MRLPLGMVALFVTINFHAVLSYDKKKIPLSNEAKDEGQQLVMDLANNFSFSFAEKSTIFEPKSRVLSPLGHFMIMSMLAYVTTGETRRDFLRTIKLYKSKTRMAKFGYKKFLNELSKCGIRMKSKIFVPAGVTPTPHFTKLIENFFNLEFEALDVTDGFMETKKIEEWIAAQTNNEVTQTIKPHPVGRAPGIIFMNTVYFKGTWKKPFDKSLTVLRPFYAENKQTVDVPTMYTLGRFKHGWIDDLGAQFIELPYASNGENETMSMFIILRDESKHPIMVPLSVLDPEILMTKLSNSTEKDVEIYLPKFKIETDMQLDQRLSWYFQTWFRFGLTAGDSKILDPSTSLNVTETKTKIVIEVDESGQRAAGSNGLSYNTTEPVTPDRKIRSVPQGVTLFKVDHYFVGVVMMKGKILTETFFIHFTGSEFLPRNTTTSSPVWKI